MLYKRTAYPVFTWCPIIQLHTYYVPQPTSMYTCTSWVVLWISKNPLSAPIWAGTLPATTFPAAGSLVFCNRNRNGVWRSGSSTPSPTPVHVHCKPTRKVDAAGDRQNIMQPRPGPAHQMYVWSWHAIVLHYYLDVSALRDRVRLSLSFLFPLSYHHRPESHLDALCFLSRRCCVCVPFVFCFFSFSSQSDVVTHFRRPTSSAAYILFGGGILTTITLLYIIFDFWYNLVYYTRLRFFFNDTCF